MAKLSVEARGLPYYHGLNKQYPIHWSSFTNMHERIDYYKLITDFPRNYQGFKNFVAYLGDVPVGMKKPTVGRKDHSIGYVKGNFTWQEFSENSAECGARIILKNVKNSPNFVKQTMLKDWLKTISVPTKITESLSALLGYSCKRKLMYGIKRFARVDKEGPGRYIIVP